MKSCPQCNTKCLNKAPNCDCGYIFQCGADTTTPESALPESAEKLHFRQSVEEYHKRSEVPLTFWESVYAAFSGAGLGLLGLLFIWPRANRFESEGYSLKSKKSWRLYWFAFGIRLAAVAMAIFAIFVASH